MASFGVVKEFYEKYPMPGMTSPLVNKYSEHCKKQHMPTKVKVVPKKFLVKAIELALQKDGDVSKNVSILNLNEEVEVSKLNEKNFCCISHRWCTTELSVDKFCEIFSQFLKNGYLCAEDTCFEEKKFYEHFSNWWAFTGKLVEMVFPKMEGAEEFMAYLAGKTSLLGFKDFKEKLQVEPDSIDDMSEGMMGLMMGKATMEMDSNDISENTLGDYLLERIKRFLIFAIPQGAYAPMKKADVAQMLKFVKDQKISFQTSNPEKLFQQLYEVIQKCLNNLAEKHKLKESVFMKRFDDCLKYIDQMKNFKNKSNKFNGQDPVAMATLMMLQDSQFEYFWADVFCTPQRKEDIEETLKAVKDGMAVFSLATVIICPPFLTEKLIEYNELPLADLVDQSKFEEDLTEYYKKFPYLTLNEKCFLFSDPVYFARMWTLHEQGIAHTLYYWWQYLLGPFSKPPGGSKKSLTFKIDSMYNNNYKAGLDQSSLGTTMSRSTAVSMLRSIGPGDALTTMFQDNFTTMQTGFALDWELLATSIFNLDKNKSVSEQILTKKLKMYQTYVLQYSPAGAKYSYAWFKNPQHITHCFKFNDKWELVASCVDKPEEHNPKPMKFTAKSGGDATLGNEVVLKGCTVYQIQELTYDGFFSPCGQYVLYHLIGPRKTDLEKEPSSGYLIQGKWTLPKFLADARVDAVKALKEHMPKNSDASTKKSYQMMFDHLKPTQDIVMVKSSNPKHDFMVVFGVIPNQNSFAISDPKNEKTKKNKKLDKIEFTMN